MKKIILGFTLFTGLAFAARYIDTDALRSTDHTKTYSLPAATDTLTGRASTDTLTNKSISGSTNTLTNIPMSASTGTLAVANGGTGQGSFAAGIIRSNGAALQSTTVNMTTEVQGTLGVSNGGTGQSTANAGFNALSPMTTGGDLIYGGASGVATRLANGSNGQVLTSSGGTAAPTWTAVGVGSVTSVTGDSTITGGPITTSGTLAVNTGTGVNQIVKLNGSAQIPAVDGSLLTSLYAGQITTGTLAVARGGTALASTPSNGQLLIGNGTNYTLGTLGQGTGILVTNSAGTISVAVNVGTGASQIVQLNGSAQLPAVDGSLLTGVSAAVPTRSYEISNLGLATSVGSSALTISLKQSDGSSDPGAGASAVKAGFRSSTLTSGLYNQRSATAATSLVISSGSTLGQVSNVATNLWVYLIDNAGTLELAASGTLYGENALISTTAEGGAGAADSGTVMYSTTARSNVPFRLIGLLINTQVTTGTWASAGTTLQVGMFGALASSNVWYIDATMDGANPSLGTSDVASYTEIINAGLTLKPQPGSQPVGVMCSTTNAATAPSTSNTTCAAGSESLGVNFTIPEAGAYEVCWEGEHYSEVNQSAAAEVTFQLIETPTNAQTLTLEGGSRIGSYNLGMTIATGTSQAIGFPRHTCSIFNWTSVGTKGVRLMFEQDVTGTVSASLILADAGAASGQKNMSWKVKRIH